MFPSVHNISLLLDFGHNLGTDENGLRILLIRKPDIWAINHLTNHAYQGTIDFGVTGRCLLICVYFVALFTFHPVVGFGHTGRDWRENQHDVAERYPVLLLESVFVVNPTVEVKKLLVEPKLLEQWVSQDSIAGEESIARLSAVTSPVIHSLNKSSGHDYHWRSFSPCGTGQINFGAFAFYGLKNLTGPNVHCWCFAAIRELSRNDQRLSFFKDSVENLLSYERAFVDSEISARILPLQVLSLIHI